MTSRALSRFRPRSAGRARGRAVSSLLAVLVALAACGTSTTPPRAEGLDTSAMPVETRADYAVFAVRCSKCHSLARPLNSGIVDDDYWAMYVARMRRQPGSGISETDATTILRFLHWYSLDQKRRKAERDAAQAQSPVRPQPVEDAGP